MYGKKMILSTISLSVCVVFSSMAMEMEKKLITSNDRPYIATTKKTKEESRININKIEFDKKSTHVAPKLPLNQELLNFSTQYRNKENLSPNQEFSQAIPQQSFGNDNYSLLLNWLGNNKKQEVQVFENGSTLTTYK